MREKIKAKVLRQEQIGVDVFDLTLRAPSVAAEAKPGQFVAVYCRDMGRILPRPISICEIREEKLRLVYRRIGQGTTEFSRLKTGDEVEILGPLGNGYPLWEGEGTAFLIGGGIGIPPLLELSKQLSCKKKILLGYRDELFLLEDFVPHGQIYAATEEGFFGTKGNVMDIIREKALTADVIYACGPKPMLRAIKSYAQEQGLPAWISMEERMACGIGACLACVCTSKELDAHSNLKSKRICKDGPVFEAGEVEL